MTNNGTVRKDQLITTLGQVKATINSRPLTSISGDTDDLTVLTPNHFIFGLSLNAQGVVDVNEKGIVLESSRKSIKYILERFYQRIYTIAQR